MLLSLHAATVRAETPSRAAVHDTITDSSWTVVPGVPVDLDSPTGTRVAKTV